jgi:hypothetical protein
LIVAFASALLSVAPAAQPLPARDDVRRAIEGELNSLCGGEVENDGCVSHPRSAEVRNLRCRLAGDELATCRYERRVRSIGGRPRWHPAETRFVRNGRHGPWSLERDFPLTPERVDVEGALRWQYGHVCRMLIDHCLDQNGNEIEATPEFAVSALECRRAGDRRATCSFTSIKSFGLDDVLPSERCTGTLQRRDGDGGDASWTFLIPDPRRRPYAALLSCN